MRKKIFKLALTGFILGMIIGNLISFLTCDKSAKPLVIVSKVLIERTGSVRDALIVNTLLSGLLGMVSFIGVIFHDPDEFDWGMTKAAVYHFLLIMAFNIPIALYCGWVDPDFVSLLIWIGMMALSYFIVWLIMYLRCKKETEELNKLLKKQEK
jgi:hypothetical protein